MSLTREQYEALPGVNWSTLRHVGRSPAHYLHEITTPSTADTDALQRGRVLAMAMFEPERFARDVVVWHQRRAGKEWEAFESANAQKEIITSRTMENVQAMARAARGHAIASRYLAGGKAEHTIQWHYRSPTIAHLESFEFQCKGRLDFVADCGAIVDLKSARDASPEAFGRAVVEHEYHAQAAFYSDGYEAKTGERLPFVFVAVESAAPHVVQVYRVPEDILELGRERYRQLLATLNVCRKESRWPGYAETEMNLELPRWARPRDDDDAPDADLVFGG